jgi:hypothetical protein
LRNVVASLLGLFRAGAAQPEAGPEVRLAEPAAILFSMSTIADDMAALEPVGGEIAASDLVMHEDEWRQTEFFAQARLPEIQAMLVALARSEAANRSGAGFRGIFTRRLAPGPVLSGADPLAPLLRELSVPPGPGPVLHLGGNAVAGRVAHGFSLRLGPQVALYGVRDGAGIMVLGAHLGPNGDQAILSRAFVQLNRSNRLIMVDWRAHLALAGIGADGQIEVWRP